MVKLISRVRDWLNAPVLADPGPCPAPDGYPLYPADVGPAGLSFERHRDKVVAVGRDRTGKLVLMEELSPEAADWLGHHLINQAYVASGGRRSGR